MCIRDSLTTYYRRVWLLINSIISPMSKTLTGKEMIEQTKEDYAIKYYPDEIRRTYSIRSLIKIKRLFSYLTPKQRRELTLVRCSHSRLATILEEANLIPRASSKPLLSSAISCDRDIKKMSNSQISSKLAEALEYFDKSENKTDHTLSLLLSKIEAESISQRIRPLIDVLYHLKENISGLGTAYESNKKDDFLEENSEVTVTDERDIIIMLGKLNFRTAFFDLAERNFSSRLDDKELRILRKSFGSLQLGDSSDTTANQQSQSKGDHKPFISLELNLRQDLKSLFSHSWNIDFRCDYDFCIIKVIECTERPRIQIGRVVQKTGECFSFSLQNENFNFFMDLVKDFSKIISENDKELKALSTDGSGLLTKEFYRRRENNENQLERILNSLDSCLGFLKLLFLSDLETVDTKENALLEKALNNFMQALSQQIRQPKIDHLLQGLRFIIQKAIICCLYKRENLQTIKSYIEEYHSSSGFQSVLSKNKFSSLLETFLNELGELIKDLRINDGTRKNLRPLLLILDESLSNIAIEYLPFFKRVQQAFYRLPSLALLQKKPNKEKLFSNSKVTLVINPSGELSSTQKEFKPFCDKYPSWKAHYGAFPSKAQFSEALQRSDFYIYMGHGAGEQFLKIEDIINVQKVRSICVLAGCSSARLISNKEVKVNGCEAKGIAYNLLLSGCPALIGTLWTVTDKDIDRFMKKFLEQLALKDSFYLHEILSTSQDSCKFSNLTGNSVVLYGFPVKIVNNLMN
eukprot:TRINITY_DN11590_c0_g3_i1.p1 TRINITY_DN11590_c0_g3~~TRINITY_DN11590_c0_g3_i1.p1  ORF type:complete len:749 (-),score=71.14 TRINITY_DN11590_c0_g3_i1:18-2264(-)